MDAPNTDGRLKRVHGQIPVKRLPLARKFMQTLDDHVYNQLSKFADQRGVTVQGLIRAVIVPDWISSQPDKERAPATTHPAGIGTLPQRPRANEIQVLNPKKNHMAQR